MVDTAVIPVAGLGTRMLPATKEQPKEMLPVPIRDPKHGLVFKPFVQIVFEQLYEVGVRNFIFVVGRGKRVIEDYFTPDWGYVMYLEQKGKKREAELLYDFYNKLESSRMVWVNQPEPRGFGDAVYRGGCIVGDRPFIVHAGDIIVMDIHSLKSRSLERLIMLYGKYKPEALLLVKKVKDPRHYGVAVAELLEDNERIYAVRRVVEKPPEPISDMAITAIYVFRPSVVEALRGLKPSQRGEVEVTDAIQALVDGGHPVMALEAPRDEVMIDIGRPETYIEAIKTLSGINSYQER